MFHLSANIYTKTCFGYDSSGLGCSLESHLPPLSTSEQIELASMRKLQEAPVKQKEDREKTSEAQLIQASQGARVRLQGSKFFTPCVMLKLEISAPRYQLICSGPYHEKIVNRQWYWRKHYGHILGDSLAR